MFRRRLYVAHTFHEGAVLIFVAVSDWDDISKMSCQMKQWIPAAPTDSQHEEAEKHFQRDSTDRL